MSQSQEMSLLTSHQTSEWYTPPWIIEKARRLLGRIDLDPASCQRSQEWIKAFWWYGLDHPQASNRDGLAMPWAGRVGLNPPYGKAQGKSNAERWSGRLMEEYAKGNVSAALLLVNSTHGYRWYEHLWRSYPCCLLEERVQFVGADGLTHGPAKRGQTLVYMGPYVDGFGETFAPYGRVLR
jgi:ParB family transcriptional regulator, chromosome partitioning protein